MCPILQPKEGTVCNCLIQFALSMVRIIKTYKNYNKKDKRKNKLA